jgi:multidrug efflux pump subunit AcrA (membrane-fusion protein)
VLDGQRVVYVMRDGKLTAVPIVLGTSSDTNSQVVQGELAAGDTIVLNPPVVLDTNAPPGGGFLNRR